MCVDVTDSKHLAVVIIVVAFEVSWGYSVLSGFSVLGFSYELIYLFPR